MKVRKKTEKLHAASQQSWRSKPERKCVRAETRKDTLESLN